MILGASQLRTRLCGRSSLTAGTFLIHARPAAPDSVDTTHGDSNSKIRRRFWYCAQGVEDASSPAVACAQYLLPKWGPPTS
jgi:hypothetical protein